MSKLLDDIHTQGPRLRTTLAHNLGAGRRSLEQAGTLLASARRVVITGIGSSWHAGMAVQHLCWAHGIPAQLEDASELIRFRRLEAGTVVIALSRSGRSVEIVRLLDQVRSAGATLIAVTNTPDSPLATAADAVLLLATGFDHQISIAMYSGLALVGGLAAAAAAAGGRLDQLGRELDAALAAAAAAIPGYSAAIAASAWPGVTPGPYLLARGGSLASANETRLLWEEGAKAGATACTTGGFRHGPQEVVGPGLRVAVWIDRTILRQEDALLCADLRRLGAQVLVIGHDLGDFPADLACEVPATPDGWQFLVDIVPGQLVAERVASLRQVDCDSFRHCPYIIAGEGGITG